LEGVILLLKNVNTQKYFLRARRAVFGFPMGGSNLSNGRKQILRLSEEIHPPVSNFREHKNSCISRFIFVIL
jgi:hypothetical protein